LGCLLFSGEENQVIFLGSTWPGDRWNFLHPSGYLFNIANWKITMFHGISMDFSKSSIHDINDINGQISIAM
jgi:hypothetical protein